MTRASIEIDDAHDMMKKGAPYSIPPCTELVLDGSGHVFKSADAAAPGQPHPERERDPEARRCGARVRAPVRQARFPLRLLACAEVPLEYRMLDGFLDREGKIV